MKYEVSPPSSEPVSVGLAETTGRYVAECCQEKPPRSTALGAFSPQATIIVPTLNESQNISPLVERIEACLVAARIDAEIVIVDGGSTDGSVETVRQLRPLVPVRLLQTSGQEGLAWDVVQAARLGRGRFAVVLDADLSHPPERIVDLLKPLLKGRCDMTIASRYVPGGSTPEWPLLRRLSSRLATGLADPLVDVRDPMSGFFALDRIQLVEHGSDARGFKIALEIFAKSGSDLRVKEVPIEFRDRQAGHSKMGGKQALDYIGQIVRLSGGQYSVSTFWRWAMVGLLGMGVDLACFTLLSRLGFGVLASHTASFLLATLTNFLLNWKWAFRLPGSIPSYGAYLTTCGLAYIIRAGVVEQMTGVMGWPTVGAVAAGIGAGAVINYIGSAWFVFAGPLQGPSRQIRWRVLALATVALSVLVRLLYGGLMDLIPEEAYYWGYAQHLDLGYLDHPPMVAWVIWASTSLLGRSDLAVRIPSMLCWLGTAWFVYKSARLLFDKTTAYVAVGLLACLPIYFLTGLLATPDAMLYLFWTATVYYLQCALLLNHRRAWYAVGLLGGLGMLSKYTFALLGLGVLVFLICDRRARRQLIRPQLWLALAIATAVFSPVIFWNANHDWVSFAFQSSRRLAQKTHFGLPALLGAMALLVTPLGFVGSLRSILPGKFGGVQRLASNLPARARKLTACLVLAPLAVFVLFSLQHNPKLNWAGVVFLAALGPLARDITTWNPRASWIVQWARSAWRPTMVLSILGMGLMGLYSVAEFPGLTPVDKLNAFSPSIWSELSHSVEHVRSQVSDLTGTEAAVVGMDKYFISSQLAYQDGTTLPDGQLRVAGRGIFPKIFTDDLGLMWNTWAPRHDLAGRPVVLISFDRPPLEKPRIDSRFQRLSPIRRLAVCRDGRLITSFFWRAGYGYRDQ